MQVRLLPQLTSQPASTPRFLMKSSRLLAIGALLGLALSHSARADVTKANNTDALNLGTSYVGGTPPTATDILNIDATVAPATAGATTTAPLGASLSLLGINLTNPGGPFTIGNTPGAVLSLGASGINLVNAAANLTISNSIALTANQTWNVGTGFTLTTNNGPITGARTLTLGGAGGTVTMNNNLTLVANGNAGENTITLTGGVASVAVGQSVTSSAGIGTNAIITAINGNVITLSTPNTGIINGGSVVFTGNTYSGGTVLNAGTVLLGSGAPSFITSSNTSTGTAITAGTVNSGVLGTGNLTINNGVTLATGSQQNSLSFSLINIAGNFALGGGTVASPTTNVARMAINGTFDMGGATRVVTLNKSNGSVASGNEILTVGSRGATGFVPVFQNGTIDFEPGAVAQVAGAAPATVTSVTTVNFTNNAGLIIGPNVVWNQNAFGTGANAPTLTVNGLFYSGSGTIARSAEVYSLSGTGLFTNASSAASATGSGNGTANLTISGASGTATFAGQINDGTTALVGGSSTGAANTAVVSLTKTGGSTQILTGTNTYSGVTVVNGGTLLINGANTGNGVTTATPSAPIAATVNSGGTLGGSGSIAQVVTINAGGILLGGSGITGSTFTLSNNLTLAPSNGTNTGIIQLTLGAGGSHSTLARTGGTWTFASGQQFLFTGTAAPTVGVNYNDIIKGLTADPGVSTFVINNPGYTGTFTFDGVNVDLMFSAIAVPEPSTYAIMLLSGAGLFISRHRMRRRVQA